MPQSKWAAQVDSTLKDRQAGEDDDDEEDLKDRNSGAMPFAADFDTAAETGWQEDPTSSSAQVITHSSSDAGRSVPSTQSNPSSRRACGVVVGIVKRGWRPYVSVLDMESSMGGSYLAEPLDQRIPRINISTRQPETLSGKLVIVAIDFWDANHRFPTGTHRVCLQCSPSS